MDKKPQRNINVSYGLFTSVNGSKFGRTPECTVSDGRTEIDCALNVF